MANQKSYGLDWKQWLENVNNMPSAAYVIQNDDRLNILGGNEQFYKLFSSTPVEMQQKYANRLSAIVDSSPLAALPNVTGEVQGPFSFPQQLINSGGEAWIYTELYLCPDGDSSVLCCQSYDISEYQNNTRDYFNYIQASHLAADKTGVDYFQYNPDTDEATVLSSFSILQRSLADSNGVISGFLNKMMSGDYICPGYQSTFKKAIHSLKGNMPGYSCELQMTHGENAKIWVRLTIIQNFDLPLPICILEDFTHEKEAVRNYLDETQFFQAILKEKAAFGQVDVTENKITRLGGLWNLYHEIIDKVTYSQLIEEFINKVVHPDDRANYLEIMQSKNFIKSLENGIDHLDCDFRRIVDQNKMIWMHLDVHLFQNPITRHVMGLLTIENIDAQKKLEYLLTHESASSRNMHSNGEAEKLIRDHLTNFYGPHSCAFLLLNIEGDSDNQIEAIQAVLSNTFRQSDVISGYTEREFLIYIKNIQNRDQISKRMDELFSTLEGKNFNLTYHAGVTISDKQAGYDQLFHQADCALVAAKEKNEPYLFYEAQYNLPATKPTAPAPQKKPQAEASYDHIETANFERYIGEHGDIAYLVDPSTYELICGNKAFYDRLGLSPVQCVGMKCYKAMHNRETPCPFCSKANWPTDKYYMWRNINTFLEQEFLIKNKLINWKGKEALLAFAIDISNDKSIVDSLSNDTMESHAIISGVQHMAAAENTPLAMESALETIGTFFRADSATFWQYEKSVSCYRSVYSWQMSNKPLRQSAYDDKAISKWIDSQTWEQPLMIESPESMLGNSYEMFQVMKSDNINNGRWIRIRQNDQILGFVSIQNVSSNLENMSFLESFGVFIGSELEKRNLIAAAEASAAFDELTGLHSHKHFEKFIAAYSPDNVVCIGAIVANFNSIKEVNSSRGFETGNFFIKQFADMLKRVFKGEHMFRIGGDEFLIVLPDVQRDALSTYLKQLEELLANQGAFTVSIGHSWDDVENDLTMLIEQATQAMKVNKKRHYDSQPDIADAERRKMLADLVTTIENRAFEVFLQPKVTLGTCDIVGAEALIRYKHPQFGYVPPSSFIEILEKNHFIRYIDLFVLEETCKSLESWKKQGLFLPKISVNFSRLTMLEQDILTSMEAIISRYDVSREHIEIEITESIASMGKSMLYKATKEMFDAGYSISLDDFGTKYTNLSILADLNFSTLKVDKSLVSALPSKPNHRVVMKNVISMCHDLGMNVIAEGIEMEDQQNILLSLGCDLGQGYLYGKPMPISDFVKKFLATKV